MINEWYHFWSLKSYKSTAGSSPACVCRVRWNYVNSKMFVPTICHGIRIRRIVHFREGLITKLMPLRTYIYIYISIYDCLVLFLRKQRWVLVEFPHINAIQVDDIQSLHLQYQVVYSTYVWIMTGAWKAIYSWFDFQRHLTERSNNEKHPRNVSFHQIRNTSFSQLSVQAKSRLLRNDLQSHIGTMYSN